MKRILLLTLLSALSALPAWAIDLNTATVNEIAALKGMTPETAEAIVAARTQFGPFRTSADVLKISGVTQGILNQNRATLTIAGKPVTTRSGTAPAIPGLRPAIPAKKADLTTAAKSAKDTRGKSQSSNGGRDAGKSGADHGKGGGGDHGGDHGGGRK